MSELYRQLPSVDALLRAPVLRAFPHNLVRTVAREHLATLRARIQAGELTAVPDVAAELQQQLLELKRGRLGAVINATGVVIHTNLGRSAWSPRAQGAARTAMRYCNVELELHSGKRGGRLDGVRRLVQQLTGAEDVVVVNNCAAAVLLSLTALARDREVVVSRGELVEIGGSFRVPEVISAGGARLVEVGTTNRTRVADFASGTTPSTAAWLRVHRSNFSVVGFVEDPDPTALGEAAAAAGVPLLLDLGSGELGGKDSVRAALATGASLVMFSGDKLLGGPQAGLIVGAAEWVQRLRQHPLYRALRVGKVTLAALEATLIDHLFEEPPPTLAMLRVSLAQLQERAERLSVALAEVPHRVQPGVGRTGGGAKPTQELASVVLVLEGMADAAHQALRLGNPAVVARVSDGEIVLDLRTIFDDQILPLAARIRAVARRHESAG